MTVAIVGLGYVGVPLATAFAEAGQEVLGIDVDPLRVEALARGESYVEDVESERWAAVLDRVEVTTSYAGLARADAIVICVPTPLSDNREPELGALTSAARGIRDVLRAGQLVILESTTYPGTTRERVLPLLEESGLAAGRDFNLAFSPERVDPGRTDYTLRTTPKIVGGLTTVCAERARELYELVCDEIVPVSTPEAAELAKLLENIFRSVNIALVNELAMLANRMGIDVWEVIDAAATKPYGFMRFDPGPGMGGHCLPVDPFYLSWRARQFHFQTEFIELAGKVNQQMPYHCLERAVEVLNDAGKPVRGSRILLVGVSYKAGVGDTRESPALALLGLLADRGAELAYHDPHVPELPSLGLSSSSLADAELADLVIIVTAHPSVDHEAIAAAAPLVLDLRGVTRALSDVGSVVRL